MINASLSWVPNVLIANSFTALGDRLMTAAPTAVIGDAASSTNAATRCPSATATAALRTPIRAPIARPGLAGRSGSSIKGSMTLPARVDPAPTGRGPSHDDQTHRRCRPSPHGRRVVLPGDRRHRRLVHDG